MGSCRVSPRLKLRYTNRCMPDNGRLLLIDGHAILHRAYHAIPPLSGPGGIPVNAVYGFLGMLLRVITDLKPQYLAVAFDLPAPTFRQKIYARYQAQRPEMADGLSSQIALLHELLETMRVEHFEMAGYEADDVIGTLAKNAGGLGAGGQRLETIIVSGDRDMLQLINENTMVCIPVRGLSETKIYTARMVREEFGVEPAQWADVKALKGDPSDNYPGVRGIGPKSAEKLIAQYQSLENLYANMPEIAAKDKKLAEKLTRGALDAQISKKLATIACDAPVSLDPGKARLESIDWSAGTKYMREKLGFKSLVERINKGQRGGADDGKTVDVQDKEQMKLL